MGHLVKTHRLGATVDTRVHHRFSSELEVLLGGDAPVSIDEEAAAAFSDLHTPEALGDVLIRWSRIVLRRQGLDAERGEPMLVAGAPRSSG